MKCSTCGATNCLLSANRHGGFICSQCSYDSVRESEPEFRAVFLKLDFPVALVDLMAAKRSQGASIGIGGAPDPRCGRHITDWLEKNWPALNIRSIRYAVRCLPLRPGKGWTVGVFGREDQAREFRAFWGGWIYTEVATLKIEPGEDAWEKATDYERTFNQRRPVYKPTPPLRPWPAIPTGRGKW